MHVGVIRNFTGLATGAQGRPHARGGDPERHTPLPSEEGPSPCTWG
ncbi:hypothetical protein SAMN05428996_0013 [Quadrisphaera sp. DSM 44207]|nr:hypothetical protein SAMN05428996_0013 [Quadrisphaera sp. DSM 44207]